MWLGVPPVVRGVTTVLALDDNGLAGAWVKSYGGPPGHRIRPDLRRGVERREPDAE